MLRSLTVLLLAFALLLGSAVARAAPRELTWSQLIPAPIHDLANALSEAGPAASQQSPNAPVVKALDGIEAKLPGYIVPLEISEAGLVTEFLLVPYYGACIHVPPPPSNQIVYVKTAKGVQMDELYQPFWVEGTFKVENASSELAAAGYRMQASKVTPYEYEGG
ncbi:DUF3299 domain-containing protein [Pseudomonas aeruginosa]|uniref:DUF3299 domain-containing protein n=1 Tax=Pseudomonas aeruginosa TaxID=287 RepID=UPI00202F6C85|nr:DUF3299 domain-containing protein [Pseudomonas aeruginosa]MCM0289678.1 DUF3299 domain-containing protein [Pseudomonas aeruginosa]